jgi:hypothetical protein
MTLAAYCSTLWRGVLISSCFWLCVLILSLWYWRVKLKELRKLFEALAEEGQTA